MVEEVAELGHNAAVSRGTFLSAEWERDSASGANWEAQAAPNSNSAAAVVAAWENSAEGLVKPPRCYRERESRGRRARDLARFYDKMWAFHMG